jgi:uncharacterized membrane protein
MEPDEGGKSVMTFAMTTMTKRHAETRNINDLERILSVFGGGALIGFGLLRRSPRGYALAALGGTLVQRGATGHCYMYQALGLHTDRRQGANLGVPYELGIRVDKAITVNKPAEELYGFWRNLWNLPRFLRHVESVRVIDDKRSHWTVRGPAGLKVEWEAEIINDEPNRVIGWRSIPGSDVDTGGSVRFQPAPGHRGTEVRVSLQYNPPGGDAGAVIAKLFGEDPAAHIAEDLRRFKQYVEAGEIATTEGQPSGRQNEKTSSQNKQKRGGWDRDRVEQASEESFPASDAPSFTPEAL